MQGDVRTYAVPQISDGLVWKIALGVFIGTVAAGLVMWAAFELRVRWEVERAAATTAKVLLDSQRQIQSQIAASRRVDEARVQEQEALKQQAAQQQREALLVLQRRQAAWQAFYKPSAACLGHPADIECANEHVRAKKAFEASYVDR